MPLPEGIVDRDQIKRDLMKNQRNHDLMLGILLGFSLGLVANLAITLLNDAWFSHMTQTAQWIWFGIVFLISLLLMRKIYMKISAFKVNEALLGVIEDAGKNGAQVKVSNPYNRYEKKKNELK